MTLTLEQMKKVHQEIALALDKVAKDNGLVSITCQNLSYNGDNFHGHIVGVQGMSPEAQKYDRFCKRLSLPPLGTKFEHRGHSYLITGLNRTATKVVTQREDKQTWLFSLDLIGFYTRQIENGKKEMAK